MNNFRRIKAMKVTFFSKRSKFYVHFENPEKVPEHIDAFEDNCVWTCSLSFSLLWQEYMWWAVNVLKSDPKISHPTKTHATQLNLCDINSTFAEKCCRADLNSVLDPLTNWLPKGVAKHEFYGIQVTIFFGMNNFGDTESMTVISFSKCWKFDRDFKNAIKLIENVEGLKDNCIWTCCGSFCQLRQDYMWWAANKLKSGPKTSDLTKRHDTQLNLFDINEMSE